MAKVTIGTKEFEAAPLNFKSLKRHAEILDRLQAGEIKFSDMGVISEIVFDSLKRADPTVTQDYIDENLDLANAKGVLNVVLAASGGVEAKPGE